MILSLLIQLFFSLQEVQPKPLLLEVQAAYQEQEELISGFDEVTQLPYSHALPSIDATSFGPQRIDTGSLGILTTANSALVIDKRTQSVLFDKASEDKRSIASITKLMTVLTIKELGIDMQKMYTVDQSDYLVGGKIHYYTGEQFYAQDLWLGALIASDNVAIRALVRNTGLAYEDFIAAMNKKAVDLGMQDSSFVEPTGINALNTSTAKDIAILLEAALSDPDISDALRRPSYTFTPINKESFRTVENTNILVNSYLNEDPYAIIGGKTGFTYEAGYCLAVLVEGPEPNQQIIVVVLGADTINDRFQEAKGLIDWTYDNYRW